MRLVHLALLPVAWSCSYVEIPYPGSPNATSYMIARSMELSDLSGRVSYTIQAVPAHVTGGRYAFVAPMNLIHLPGQNVTTPADGLNEAGLSVSALILSESVYETPQSVLPEMKAEYVVRELLSRCDSVESALNLLTSVRVVSTALTKVFPCHLAIADASGRSVVVEYLQGQRLVHENAPRVLTNDPHLEWHWRNLNTFANLNPHFPQQNDFLRVDTGVGPVPRAVGHGWNLFGLPGDSSPPSRFVRLFYLRGYALHASAALSAADATVLGTSLLNNVFIPYGTVAPEPSSGPVVDAPEYTPYAVLKSPSERRLLVRGYRNSQWRQIDLKRLDLTRSRTWPLEDGTLGIVDITGDGSEVVV